MTTTQAIDALAAARGIGGLLAANAERSDREGRMPPESLQALRDAGLLRMYVPQALGGLEADPVTHVLVQEELARRDSAAGWALQVTSSSAWWCSRLPGETVDRIYATGPDQVIAVSFGSPVEGAPVAGGWRINGQRPLASLVRDADWVWLTMLSMRNGEPETVDGSPVVRAVFFPAAEAEVVATWDALGMRGTDSNDVRVQDVFVPEAQSFRIGIDHTPRERYEGPLYRSAVVVAPAASVMAGVALGVARAAIDEFVGLATDKTPFSSSSKLRERAVAQAAVGRAEGLLRSARAFLLDRVGNGCERAQAGGDLTLDEKAEVLLAAVQALAASVRAVDLVYGAAGTSGVYKPAVLERLFRDAQVLRQHGFIAESRYETVGQVAMGLPPELGFVAL